MNKNKKPQCAKCQSRANVTSNGYCKSCNKDRIQQYRTGTPQPVTEGGRQVRRTVDSTFAYLAANPGAKVTINGVTISSNTDGTINFPELTEKQKETIGGFVYEPL